MSLREQLLTALAEWGVVDPESLDDSQNLISGGLLDSTALFSLSLWVEEQIGRPVDPTTFEVATEWDTIQRILAFIERGGPGQARAEAAAVAPSRTGPVVNNPRVQRTPDGLEIVRYSPEYESAVLELQKRLWSSDETLNARFFRWRYETNPSGHQYFIFLAFSKAKPVAMRAAFPSRWQAGVQGSEHIWYQSDDLVVLTEYESKGIFAAFAERIDHDLADAGCRFFLSMSALRVTRLQSLAYGAKSLGPMRPVGLRPLAARLEDSIIDLSKRVPGMWRVAAQLASRQRAASAFSMLDDAPAVTLGDTRLSISKTVRPADMAQLVGRLGYDGRIRQVRDERYFAWRFDNPLHDYRFVYAQGHDGLDGYLVLERTLTDRGNPRIVNVADWEAGTAELAVTLLQFALRHAGSAEVASWTATLPADRIEALHDAGFEPIQVEQTARGLPSVLVWPVGGASLDGDAFASGRRLLELSDWDLRMLDTSMA